MAAPDKKLLDLTSDAASGYLVFGRNAFIQKQMSSANITKAERTQSELERLKNDAIGLVADRFGMTPEAMTDRTFRRQYHRLMPLVAWLLKKRDLTDEIIADLLQEDEDLIPIWIRGLTAEHPQALTDRLSALWTPAQAATRTTTPTVPQEPDKTADAKEADTATATTEPAPTLDPEPAKETASDTDSRSTEGIRAQV